ncbi:MAG: transaldolase, partial [Rhodocyclaceae bacterium]|nr:transaldolase [Rhodocyclaceae bacterium]
LLADDTAGTFAAAKAIHEQAMRINLFVKIPGTPAGIPAIEEAIFAGVPVNVTLLFSREQYLAAAEAYLRGLERRHAAGLSLDVASVASVFISRWDAAVSGKVPEKLRNKLGIAIGGRTYRAYRSLLASDRWKALAKAGAQPQRLLWASTGTKDPAASPILYIETLAVADTVNTIPEKTLLALAAHTEELNHELASASAAAETVLSAYIGSGIDINALAERLQLEGAEAFVKSWQQMLQRIETKSSALAGD